MKRTELNIYGTSVDIYEYKPDEIKEVVIGPKKGLDDTNILLNGEFTFEGQRVRDSYYGEGATEDGKVFLVFAENINLKQLSNIFLTLGVVKAFARSALFIRVIEKAKVDLSEYKITPSEEAGATVGQAGIIQEATITEEDLAPKRKPAAKKKARKEKPATEE